MKDTLNYGTTEADTTPPEPSTQPTPQPDDTTETVVSEQTVHPSPPDTAPATLTMSADDLSKLLTQAEERGYRRASAVASTPDDDPDPGLYEEPDALNPPPTGWKASPLLTTRRPSIWDR